MELVEWGRMDDARKLADQSSSSTALANVTDLVFPVLANTDYAFDFFLLFQTPALTTGIGFAITCPAGGLVAYEASIPIAGDGTGGTFHGHGTSSGDLVMSTAIPTINTVFLARLWGLLRNGANAGNLQLQFRSEVSTSQVILKAKSWGVLYLT